MALGSTLNHSTPLTVCRSPLGSQTAAGVRIMAKHTTVDGVEPDAVTKAWLTRYFLAQVKGAGGVTLCQNLRSLWLWFAHAYELSNPMAGIDMPKGKPALVQAPTQADIEAILGANPHRAQDRYPMLSAGAFSALG